MRQKSLNLKSINTIYLEPVCPLFWGLNPPKQGLFQSKQGSVGFQVYIYTYIIYIYIMDLNPNSFTAELQVWRSPSPGGGGKGEP